MNGMEKVIEAVTAARERYQSRYTMGRLKALKPDLYRDLVEQDDEFTLLAVTGDDAGEVVDFGESTIRGWELAVRTMEELGEPEGVYHVGVDGRTGLAVIISDDKRTLDRMRDQYPQAIHMSPDEVAVLVGSMETVAAVKSKFEGSEISRVREKL